MPTLIDSLVVELGLDPSKFNKGQKEAAAAFLKTKEEATRTGKEMEARGTQAAEFFTKLRNEMLAFFAAFELGKGLKEFISTITKGDVATGNLARQLDISSQELFAWQEAARATGGSAEGVNGSMAALTQQLQQLQLTGEAGPAIGYFYSLGINIRDANGHIKTAAELYRELAQRLQGFDPAQAAEILRGIGADQGTINLIMKGRGELDRLLDTYRRFAPTDADKRAAEDRLRSWITLDDTLTKLGRTILTAVTPPLLEALNAMQRWVQQNQNWIRTEIVAAVRDFGKWLREIPWDKVKQGVEDFASKAMAIVSALGGAHRVGEAFLGLWIGAKVLAVVAGITQIATALTGLAAVGVGGGALAALLRLAPVLAPLALTGAAGTEQKLGEAPPTESYDSFTKKQAEARAAGGAPLYSLYQWIKGQLGQAPTLGEFIQPGQGPTVADFLHQGGRDMAGVSIPIPGAQSAASDYSTRTSTVTIGTINVVTQATDAAGIAHDLGPAIERSSITSQANYGLR